MGSSTIKRYRKIPISPGLILGLYFYWAYTCSKRFFAGLICGELIFGWAYYWWGIKGDGLDDKTELKTQRKQTVNGLIFGRVIIGRIFASEIWGAYIREGYYRKDICVLDMGGLFSGGLLSEGYLRLSYGGLIFGRVIIGRIFASEIWGAYIREGYYRKDLCV